MADSTEHESARVTSGRRALIAALIHEMTGMPTLYCGYSDACASLVEIGWPTAGRSLVASVVEPADLDSAARLLLGGIPPVPDELALRRLAHSTSTRVATLEELPAWATVGFRIGDERVYAHPVFTSESPSASVDAYQVDDAPPVVLVETGASGVPTSYSAVGARQLASALATAADLVDSAAP